jgi:hypothetical protein
LTDADGVAVPYGVYDIKENIGWVNVGITKDTAEFAVQTFNLSSIYNFPQICFK